MALFLHTYKIEVQVAFKKYFPKYSELFTLQQCANFVVRSMP